MLSGLSFLNLSGLLLSLAAPLLILAYLRKSRLNNKEVPSLFLLEKLPEPPIQKRKLKLPLRFFLELLCLLILALIAAWPVLKQDQNRLAVLIDNSLSMEAKHSSGLSSLDIAKDRAEQWIDQNSATSVDVFTTAPSLEKLASLRDASLKISKTSDNLPAAITSLAEKEVYKKILVISDREAVFAQSNEGFSEVESQLVGEPSKNISISDFTVSSGNKRKAQLVLKTSGDITGSVTVNLEQSLNASDWSSLDRKNLELDAGQTESQLTFAIPKTTRFLKASLSTDSKNNSISSDDVAWADSSGNTGGKTLLISPDFNSAAESGLEKLSSLAVDVVSPELFSSTDLEAYGQLIFHKSAPVAAARKPALLILPPESNPIFPVSQEIKYPRITSWKEDHPVMSYLRVPLLKPSQTQVFENSPWASEILNVEQGAILITGESQGIRFVGYGSELLPFEGKKTPSASVLLLNSLSWLSGGQGLAGTQLVGSNVTTTNKFLSALSPSDSKISLEEKKSFTLTEQGAYQFSAPDGSRTLMFANSFFPEESDTANVSSFAVQFDSNNAKPETDGSQPLWRWFCLAFLLMISLDFLWRQFDSKLEAA